MARQEAFDVEVGQIPNARLQQGAAPPGEIRPSDASVEDHVSTEQGFALRPVKADGAGRMTGDQNHFENFVAQSELSCGQNPIDYRFRPVQAE